MLNPLAAGGDPPFAPASARRRFAIVCPNFYPRTCGVGDHSVRLGHELHRRGFAVSFFSRDPVAPHPIAPDLPVTGVAGETPDVIGRQLSRAILAARPTDVILQYTPQMWNAWRFGSAALPRLAAAMKRAGIPVTLIAHELYVPLLRRPDLFVAGLSQRAQFAYLLTQCDHSFVTTESRLRLIAPYCRALGLPAPGVLRVGPSAAPAVPGNRPSAARIGVFSTAAVGKRFDIALDAFATVARELPAAELVIIGDLGPPDAPLVRQVSAAVKRHPAGGRIRFTGKLSLEEVAREIAELDVYLFPADTGANTRSSALPTALGASRPVVAFAGAETDRSVFRDGENIALVTELTASAFAAATLRLLREPALAVRVGGGARALYERHLTWRGITNTLLADDGAAGSLE